MTRSNSARVLALESVAASAEKLCREIGNATPLTPAAHAAFAELEEQLRELKSGALETWYRAEVPWWRRWW